MILTIAATARLSEGKLIYIPDDMSFDTINRPMSGFMSLLVNDVNVEFSEDRKAIAIWGLCPQTSWRQGYVTKPESLSGELQLQEENLVPGVSIRVTRSGEYWPVTHDMSSRWIYIRKEGIIVDQIVEFVAGCIVGLLPASIARSSYLSYALKETRQ